MCEVHVRVKDITVCVQMAFFWRPLSTGTGTPQSESFCFHPRAPPHTSLPLEAAPLRAACWGFGSCIMAKWLGMLFVVFFSFPTEAPDNSSYGPPECPDSRIPGPPDIMPVVTRCRSCHFDNASHYISPPSFGGTAPNFHDDFFFSFYPRMCPVLTPAPPSCWS